MAHRGQTTPAGLTQPGMVPGGAAGRHDPGSSCRSSVRLGPGQRAEQRRPASGRSLHLGAVVFLRRCGVGWRITRLQPVYLPVQQSEPASRGSARQRPFQTKPAQRRRVDKTLEWAVVGRIALLGLALLQQGLDLLLTSFSQTTNGMDMGAGPAGVFARSSSCHWMWRSSSWRR